MPSATSTAWPRPASSRGWLRAVALLLVTALVTLGGSLLGAAPAFACSCKTLDLTKLTKQADNVYVGVVTGTSTTDAGTQYQVLAQRLFKGELPSARVTVTNSASGSCALGQLEEGERWLFLTDADNVTGVCAGSRQLRAQALAKVQKELGVGERLPAPDPEKAVLTRVDSDDSQDFVRLAAPGGAAVLLGLLGLAVVGRINRR